MHNFRTWADNTGQDIEARSQWRVEQMRIQLDRLHLGVPQQLTDHLERSAAAPEARQSCGAGHGSVYPQSRLAQRPRNCETRCVCFSLALKIWAGIHLMTC